MNFRKSSKRPLNPPPSFSESYIALFATKLGQKCICSYEGTVVYYMILFPMRCMFNMVIGWKHTLKRPFYTIFMLKKPCLKVQILQYKFLDWKWPPHPHPLPFGTFPKIHPIWKRAIAIIFDAGPSIISILGLSASWLIKLHSIYQMQ